MNEAFYQSKRVGVRESLGRKLRHEPGWLEWLVAEKAGGWVGDLTLIKGGRWGSRAPGHPAVVNDSSVRYG